MQLQPGQNIALPNLSACVRIEAQATSGVDLDFGAYLLAGNGKVLNDDGMVFHGQPVCQGGALKLDARQRSIDVDLTRVPSSVDRIALTLTVGAPSRGQRFGMLTQVELVCDCDGEALRFPVDTRSMQETALIMAELYRREGVWKLRALGQGFVGGLGVLSRHFGVDIAENRLERPAPPAPAAAPPVPAPPPAPVRLEKITLEKRKPISLEKPGGDFGEILINPNWSRKVTRGFLGFGSRASIDLDLGCLIEHRDGGKYVVQALGNAFGSLVKPPYAQLMGDDRTGDSAQGEFLKINGKKWPEINRVLIFAFIYEGVPNWAEADGRITVAVPGQPELFASMDNHSQQCSMCAVAMLENDGGSLRATKLVEYFPTHLEMDRRFGFGFRWSVGRKN